MLTERNTILLLMPEIVLIAIAVYIFVVGGTRFSNRAWSLVAIGAFLVAGLALSFQSAELFSSDWHLRVDSDSGSVISVLSGPLIVDFFGHAARWLAIGLGVLFVMIAARSGSDELASELVGCVVLTFVGVMLVAQAGDLVLLFVSLELISIPTYVILFLGRRDAASAEATTKYFLLSILSSALLLYGFALLYGVAGSTDLADIQHALSRPPGSVGGVLPALGPPAMMLVFAGLGFKIAAVPFHFYAPDVYQGTTNANAGLLAVVPKIAGILALVRLAVVVEPGLGDYCWQATMALAILTMTLGNVVALWQQDLRRLLAYSSIAHAGYMLVGLAAGLAGAPGQGIYDGLSATLFYLAVYALASLGVFAALVYLGGRERQVNDVDELAGLSRRQPALAAAMAVFLFSLAGIPPLAGFWGKLLLLASTLGVARSAGDTGVSLWFIMLSIVLVLNAAIAAAYYLRIVAVIYFRDPVEAPQAAGGFGARAAAFILAAAVVVVGCSPWAMIVAAGHPPGPTAAQWESHHGSSPVSPR